MPFLAYFLVLVITVAGAALGLDALTAPPPELKQKIAAGSNAPKPRQIPIDRPQTQAADNTGHTLTPVKPAAPVVADAAAAAAPVVTPPPAATAEANPAPAPQNEPAAPAPQTVAAAEPAAAAATTALANASTANAAPVTTAQAPAASCNVQLCAATYRSFRESDCTYQPFQGERRVCERTAGDMQDTIAASPRPPEPRNEWTARSDNRRDAGMSRRDAELRAVERRVRQLTDDELLDDEPVYARPGRRVIVVETPDDRGDYIAPESYSRRWQSPGWR